MGNGESRPLTYEQKVLVGVLLIFVVIYILIIEVCERAERKLRESSAAERKES